MSQTKDLASECPALVLCMIFEVPPEWRVGTGPGLRLHLGLYLLLPDSTETPVWWRLSCMEHFGMGFPLLCLSISIYDQQLFALLSKGLFQDYSELPGFHQNRFRNWKLLRTTRPPLVIEWESGEKPCWEHAAQSPSLHAGLKAPFPCCLLVLAGSTKGRELMDYS